MGTALSRKAEGFMTLSAAARSNSSRKLDGAPHGSKQGYWRGCRCDDCRRAIAEYNAHRRRGVLPQGASHGYNSALNYGCRCQICSDAIRAKSAERITFALAGPIPEHETKPSASCLCDHCRPFTYRRVNALFKEKNDAARAVAEKHGAEWTGIEMDMVADPRRTAPELAALLGRTVAAVKHRRHLLRTDPKWMAVVDASGAEAVES